MAQFNKALCFWLTKIIRRDYLRVFGKIDEIIEVFIILINHPIAVAIGSVSYTHLTLPTICSV